LSAKKRRSVLAYLNSLSTPDTFRFSFYAALNAKR
jgi:hypothetical protein